MVKAVRGVLVKCDPHIKTILLAIDSVNHDYVIEDLDEEHLLVKENMYDALKAELEKRLQDTQHVEEDSNSDD